MLESCLYLPAFRLGPLISSKGDQKGFYFHLDLNAFDLLPMFRWVFIVVLSMISCHALARGRPVRLTPESFWPGPGTLRGRPGSPYVFPAPELEPTMLLRSTSSFHWERCVSAFEATGRFNNAALFPWRSSYGSVFFIVLLFHFSLARSGDSLVKKHRVQPSCYVWECGQGPGTSALLTPKRPPLGALSQNPGCCVMGGRPGVNPRAPEEPLVTTLLPGQTSSKSEKALPGLLVFSNLHS